MCLFYMSFYGIDVKETGNMSTDNKREVKFMEDSKEELKNNTAEGNEGAGKVDTQTTEKNQNEGNVDVDVKAEAQKIADAMVAKKMKGMPSKEELKAFKDWQETQKTEAQKQAEKETEYQKTLSEKESLAQENQVLRAGVNSDDVDYVVFKVSKMEGEFEENLEKFLKDNPKYLGKEQEQENKQTSNGLQTQKQSNQSESGVTAILKAKHPELFK